MHQPVAAPIAQKAAMPVLIALSATHLLNDMIQSLIPAIYPIIKPLYGLDFTQIGFIALAFQLAASIFQPVVGFYTDRNPMPYSMIVGMGFTLTGLIGLAFAGTYGMLLLAATCVGVGSSIFHPEATRTARNASGGQQGLAQGIFQVGGQAGGALGPLLAAFIIAPNGQRSIAWFSVAAFVAMGLMFWTARRTIALSLSSPAKPATKTDAPAKPATQSDEPAAPAKPSSAALPTATVAFAIAILIVLLFSKNVYSSSLSAFYTFYLIERFGVSVQTSQVMLFLFLAASPFGVIVGGVVGDRIGRNKIIWFSILGALPFSLMLPYASLFWTGVLTVLINLIMSSAFAAILIYAMELMPRRIGLVGGFFYGLTFGLSGLAAALLGALTDRWGLGVVYQICAFLPAIGLLAWFLPRVRGV